MHLALARARAENKQNEEARKNIYDFLTAYPSGVLCTVDPNNNPHATVIYYAIDEKFVVTFVTKQGTKKHDCLQRNGQITLVVFDPTEQTTAQIIGTAKEIKSEILLNRAFRKTMLSSVKNANGSLPPIAKIRAGEFVAYQVEPTEICMKRFSKESQSSDGKFESYQIDF